MIRSIRLRLINWLLRCLNGSREHVAQYLRGNEIQSQPRANMGLGLVLPIDHRMGQGQVDNAAHRAILDNQTRDHGRNAIINDDPIYIAYLEALSRSKNSPDLIHQFTLQSRQLADFSKLNAQALGVQS